MNRDEILYEINMLLVPWDCKFKLQQIPPYSLWWIVMGNSIESSVHVVCLNCLRMRVDEKDGSRGREWRGRNQRDQRDSQRWRELDLSAKSILIKTTHAYCVSLKFSIYLYTHVLARGCDTKIKKSLSTFANIPIFIIFH